MHCSDLRLLGGVLRLMPFESTGAPMQLSRCWRACLQVGHQSGTTEESTQTHSTGLGGSPGGTCSCARGCSTSTTSGGSRGRDDASWGGNTAGVWHVRRRGGASESLLSGGAVWKNGRVAWVEHSVDDVDDTVGNQHVGLNDTGVVNENVATLDSDSDVSAVECSQGAAVHDVGAVERWAASDHVVGKD